ncbi:putative membrane protein, TIGR04086 family [Thermosyntropha lipolytica DSM 11003]|uniref:Putative membrane protein, TIGR04086 family n=1 Tax=Thermosyntropha lipolytica DSM 11003 TaxID=1123382 RepID=A0A1M5PEP6_9FIRM|nr:TIGR04086 family membrane protein [Thermosyntropha lipolytica]SHH00230.1 putative membrane protein, TIGR04086 family [Thermosyntropha lipolytica DSM 11003]
MKCKASIEVKALGKALILSCILCLLSATIIYYTSLKETLQAPLGKIIIIIAVFTAACSITKFHGNRGLIRGISTGIAFFIIMFIATLLFANSTINMASFFSTLLFCIIAGGLGGILGIGLSD